MVISLVKPQPASVLQHAGCLQQKYSAGGGGYFTSEIPRDSARWK
jgi:hypothetical protein